MRALVADKDSVMRRRTVEILRAISAEQMLGVRVVVVSGSEALYQSVFKRGPADILFLDTNLPLGGGIKISQDLRRLDYKGFIVVTSCDAEEEYPAYLAGASAFLYKLYPKYPVRLGMCLRTAVQVQSQLQHEFLHMRSGTERFVLAIREIRYFSVEGHHVTCYWGPELHATSYASSLRQIQYDLAEDNFVRCHRNYLINCNFVEKIDKQSVALKGGICLPVSRRYVKELRFACQELAGPKHAFL
ncbi:LytTR family DNA-binding domain-containing protein [uncultured Olegusella sp.]|uniref:LytR/AlgR family response regulator transcription factor n=1 Tax=uncultured Olegusella sp. TaxID=1979846 RepID=UPI00260C7E2E|nr:LytTR family DNA-binding domain-containing protein [uncultured Olegusella sp.]